MTKKEYCETHPILSLWSDSAQSGIAVCGYEYGVYNYVYYIRVLGDKRTYHKSKIRYYDNRPYFSWKDIDIFLDDVSRV